MSHRYKEFLRVFHWLDRETWEWASWTRRRSSSGCRGGTITAQLLACWDSRHRNKLEADRLLKPECRYVCSQDKIKAYTHDLFLGRTTQCGKNVKPAWKNIPSASRCCSETCQRHREEQQLCYHFGRRLILINEYKTLQRNNQGAQQQKNLHNNTKFCINLAAPEPRPPRQYLY